MTLSTTDNTQSFTGDGSTKAFSFPYLFYDDDDLVVTLGGVTQTINTDYTVTGSGSLSGGTVTMSIAPTSGTALIIQRIVAYDQQTDFENFDGNPADVTEQQFDLVVMQTQQLAEAQNRSIITPIGTSINSNIISGTINSATKALTITSSGIAASELSSVGSSLDTTFTSLASNDLLQWDGSNWVNITLDTLVSEATSATVASDDKVLFLDTNDSDAKKHDSAGDVARIVEQQADVSSGSGTTTLDMTAGSYRKVTATGNITIDITPPSGAPGFYVLEAVNFGAHTISWTGVDLWFGGSAPTLTSSGTDILAFIAEDGGTVTGYVIGKDAS